MQVLKRLLTTYLRPYFPRLILAVILMGIAGAMTAAIAQLMQPVLDDVLGGQRRDMIVPVASAVFIVFIVRGFATYMHTLMMSKISQDVVADIQRDLSTHFLTLDLSFFHAHPSGQLISYVMNDVSAMRVAVTDVMTGFGKSLLTLIFLIAVMFYQDWKLSLMAFCVFPFAAMFVARLGRRLRKVSGSIQGEMGNLTDRLGQIFQGIRQVKAYGMESYESKRAADAVERVRDLNYKSVRIGNLSTPVNEVLVGIVFSGIIMYGGFEAAKGNITAGQLGSFLAAFTLAYEPMKKLAKLNNTIQMGVGAAMRVLSMLDTKPTIIDQDEPVILDNVSADIEFDNVSFHYSNEEVKALENISFKVPAGKRVALVGTSGGGKSTVMNLIPRFYDVQEGAVKVGGHDVRELSLSSLRSSLALVSQDITIFDDTIAANIAYGKLDASEQDIRLAAKAAAAHDFIENFPEGYNTQVGEDGVLLSGGQRQRIAIARAILRDAPILLLDEATSALDNESEKLVQEALEQLEQGRTSLVIAHRLSTVQNADEILVIDKGQIIERGTHDALLALNGTYAHMYHVGEF